MALRHSDGGWWVSCDRCQDSHDVDAQSEAAARQSILEAGWVIERSPPASPKAGAHTCLCPSCQREAG